MIVALLTYKVPKAQVDAHRLAHVDWLKQGVADGRVLFAGRKETADGGMFVARGSLDEIRTWALEDPFAIHDLCDYQFVEIVPTIFAPGLESLGQ